MKRYTVWCDPESCSKPMFIYDSFETREEAETTAARLNALRKNNPNMPQDTFTVK